MRGIGSEMNVCIKDIWLKDWTFSHYINIQNFQDSVPECYRSGFIFRNQPWRCFLRGAWFPVLQVPVRITLWIQMYSTWVIRICVPCDLCALWSWLLLLKFGSSCCNLLDPLLLICKNCLNMRWVGSWLFSSVLPSCLGVSRCFSKWDFHILVSSAHVYFQYFYDLFKYEQLRIWLKYNVKAFPSKGICGSERQYSI